MRTTLLSLVASSLVLLGGMTAACGEDDKDSDKKSDSNNSASPTPGPESEGSEEESPATPEESQPAADGELAAFCQAVVAAGQAESSGDYKKAQEEWDALSSEERRVGTECGRTCGSRRSPEHDNKKQTE